jgi:hypothetical protein
MQPAILRGRHFLRLAGDFWAYVVVNRAWGMLVLTLLLALSVLLVVVGEAAAPITLYPMF